MKTHIPPLDLRAEFREIRPELIRRTERVLHSGGYILGGEVQSFERNFARFVGTKYAVGVASGSDALLLALMALGVKAGDEVLTTPFTFIATATAICRLGAKPVFIDIEPESYNLNPDLIRKSISRKTRGIIPVHLYGNPCEMDRISSVAKAYGLFMIEDCAHACGATLRGKKVGSFGEFGAFSFYPTKNLGAMGDAGAISTNQKKLYQKIKSLHLHGKLGRDHSYKHIAIGINSRLDEIQATVLNVKLKSLAKWNLARRRAMAHYHELISDYDLDMLQIPRETKGAKAVYHQYAVRTPKRDQLREYLRSRGIAAGVYYPLPLHLQPCFSYLGYEAGDFPCAEQASREVLSLPLYPQIQPITQEKVIKEIRRFFSSRA